MKKVDFYVAKEMARLQ